MTKKSINSMLIIVLALVFLGGCAAHTGRSGIPRDAFPGSAPQQATAKAETAKGGLPTSAYDRKIDPPPASGTMPDLGKAKPAETATAAPKGTDAKLRLPGSTYDRKIDESANSSGPNKTGPVTEPYADKGGKPYGASVPGQKAAANSGSGSDELAAIKKDIKDLQVKVIGHDAAIKTHHPETEVTAAPAGAKPTKAAIQTIDRYLPALLSGESKVAAIWGSGKNGQAEAQVIASYLGQKGVKLEGTRIAVLGKSPAPVQLVIQKTK